MCDRRGKQGTGNREQGGSVPRYRFSVLCSLFVVVLVSSPVRAADDGKRIRGTVLQAAGDGVTIDVGREAGVRERTVYDVFIDGRAVKLPMTNETVYVPQKLVAELVVVEVDAKTAQAKLVPLAGSDAAPRVERGALVVSNPLKTPRNLAPVLKAMTADPPQTSFGHPVTVRVVWSDDPGDLDYFDWSSDGGALSWRRSAVAQVVWTPPLVAQKRTFKVSVTAVDTAGNRSARTVEVAVEPGRNLSSPYDRKRTLADHTQAFKVLRDIAFAEDNSAYVIDSDQVQIVKLDPSWQGVWRTDDYDKTFKNLDRIVVRGDDAYLTDTDGNRAVKLRIGPKMYLDKPVVVFGAEGTGNGQFKAPVDIALDARGEVYVLDQVRGCVQIFAQDGPFVASIGSLGQGPGQLGKPVALDIGHDGTLYVLDDGRKRMLVYKDRRLAGEFQVGAQSEQLLDLKVDPMTGRICILEGTTAQVRCFAPDGSQTAVFGQPQGDAPAMTSFYRPLRLKFDRIGQLYVMAGEGRVIHCCDAASGQEISRWGGLRLSKATTIAAGPDGDLAVLIPADYMVANLDHHRGWVKGICGGKGKTPGKLWDPVDVAVGADREIYVLDKGQANVQVFSARGEPRRAIWHGGKTKADFDEPIRLGMDPTRRYLGVLENRDDNEVKVFDVTAPPGSELRATLPASEDVLENSRCLAIGTAGWNYLVVAMKGGRAQPFKMEPIEKARSSSGFLQDGEPVGSLPLKEGVEKPTSIAISNLLLLFVAEEGKGRIVVMDMAPGRGGAHVATIADAKVLKSPFCASVDDYDRVYVWDSDVNRAVELGRQ